jgi:hypothetical protein
MTLVTSNIRLTNQIIQSSSSLSSSSTGQVIVHVATSLFEDFNQINVSQVIIHTNQSVAAIEVTVLQLQSQLQQTSGTNSTPI